MCSNVVVNNEFVRLAENFVEAFDESVAYNNSFREMFDDNPVIIYAISSQKEGD